MSGPLQPRGLQLTGPLFHCPPAFAQGNARPFHSKHTHLGLLVQTGGEGGIHTHTLNIRLQIFSTSSPKTQFFVEKQQNQQDAPSPRWQQDNRERRERTGMSMPPPEPSEPMAPGSGSMGLSQAGLPRWHQWQRTCLPVQEMEEMWVQSLGQEDPLEEDTATHSSILAGRIPWTEEPSGPQFTGSHRVRHDCSDLARTCTHPKSSLAGPWVAEHPEFYFLPSPIPHTVVMQACAHAHTHTDTETNGLRYTETHLQHPGTHT